ncbi:MULTISPECIES: ABC transporter permease subunit [unclassified Agarivorans]|uniref:ABC transporter permease subunit n=1 Tax=unclassified Agarivorans TaxID=2636026 RepID=UPI003D7CBBB0
MLSTNVFSETTVSSALQRVLSRFRDNSIAMIGFWVFLIYMVIALFGPLLAPYALDFQGDNLMQPPSWNPSGHVDNFFGTDDLGRDVFSRLIYGCQLTFGGGLLVVCFAAFIGIPLGVFSGMSRGVKSSILHHLMDTALSIPSLLIAIMVVSFLGPGLQNTLIAITLAQIPQFIRFTYIVVSAEIQKEYITAIRLDGATHYRILKNGVLPNIADAIVFQINRSFSSSLIDITALGFIGIGAQAPLPEWGAMLGNSHDLLFSAPWTVTLPGFVIMSSILSVNLVGEGLRKAMLEGVD